MIDPSKFGIGDFVTADADIHDYANTGDIFRLIDSRIPGEETSAVGWMLDQKTGTLKTDQAYKLPHDKISSVSRSKLAKILSAALSKIESKKRAADHEYQVAKDRIEGLMKYESKEQEVKSLMSRTFSWMDYL